MPPAGPQSIRDAFDAHAAALTLYARQWLPQGQAEDVVQDVFLQLVRQRRAPEQMRAWLFRSVRNASLNALRGARRRRKREDTYAEQRPTWFDTAPQTGLAPEAVQRVLAELSDDQREVVVLRIWGRLSFEEISEFLGQPVSTLWSRYRAALKHMKARLEKPCRTESL